MGCRVNGLLTVAVVCTQVQFKRCCQNLLLKLVYRQSLGVLSLAAASVVPCRPQKVAGQRRLLLAPTDRQPAGSSSLFNLPCFPLQQRFLYSCAATLPSFTRVSHRVVCPPVTHEHAACRSSAGSTSKFPCSYTLCFDPPTSHPCPPQSGVSPSDLSDPLDQLHMLNLLAVSQTRPNNLWWQAFLSTCQVRAYVAYMHGRCAHGRWLAIMDGRASLHKLRETLVAIPFKSCTVSHHYCKPIRAPCQAHIQVTYMKTVLSFLPLPCPVFPVYTQSHHPAHLMLITPPISTPGLLRDPLQPCTACDAAGGAR
jgi:hypothetical protein